ncbi:Rne/Rng family ribonuclease [Fulvimarina sp. 2208YS6-2-32]|uniref:Ribonuclease E n=1 Tax=Fulvimarina uroteuthidis TaxID=3098149 RepID=A0ABU5I6B8_9HYPH|nr:Rne/Rng family ribonuclease [Fulvimarina sp. 2208YS6-2-32]MDY8110637.1 Rne/Rng family ribonuclease [Fulvimarina sp. 2208YS6-2-32]
MANKMLIDASHPEETRVVVVRGNRVEEFDFESEHKKQLKGNIYLAKVTRVEPSLQAAFIEYGGGRHGFLAFSEIHPDYYQIPKADREALMAEELARAQAENDDDDEDAEREEQKKLKRRARSARREDGSDDSVSENADDRDGSDENENENDDSSEDDGDDDSASARSDSSGNDGDDRRSRSHAARSEGDDEDDDSEDDSDDDAAGDGDEASASGDDETGRARRGSRAKRGRRSSARGRSRRGDKNDDNGDSDGEDDGVDEIGSQDALEEVPVRQVRLRKNYKIQEVIKRRQILLVQVVKEERGNKGAALTTYLSLAGRYSVLMPNTARGGGISRKITNQSDRKRLRDMVRELEIPRGMGIILRTAGANRTKAEVKRDYEYLMRLWESVRTLTLQSIAPSLVYEEGSLIKRSIRDLYNKDIDQILVSGEAGYREAKDFMRMLMPSQSKAVQPYRDPTPIFTRQGIEPQLDKMLQPHVTLKSGGYIIINQTEALVAIDVNSGRSTREMSIENTAYQTNLEAAEEIARQLRLRDLAGLVVVDFIDMDEKRNNRAVEKKMKDCLKDDRARIQVGKISHFGLMEMSRQRIRASVLESTMKPCPVCEGVGMVRATSSMALHAIRHIEDYLQKNKGRDLIVKVSTETALFILNEKRHHIDELEQTHDLRIVIEADPSVGHNDINVEQGGMATKPIAREFVSPVSIDAENQIDEDLAEEANESEEAESPEATGELVPSNDGKDETEEREPKTKSRRRRRRRSGSDDETSDAETKDEKDEAETSAKSDESSDEDEDSQSGRRRRRRGRRGGRRQRDGSDDRQSANENGEGEGGQKLDAGTETLAGNDGDAPGKQAAKPAGSSEPSGSSDAQATSSDVGADVSTPTDDARSNERAETVIPIEVVQSTPSTADERFDDPVATMIGEAAHAGDEGSAPETVSDEAEAAPQAAAAEPAPRSDEPVEAASEPPSADMSAEHGTGAADGEAETPEREPLTEPRVTSGTNAATDDEDNDDSKPRRVGWWNRGFF